MLNFAPADRNATEGNTNSSSSIDDVASSETAREKLQMALLWNLQRTFFILINTVPGISGRLRSIGIQAQEYPFYGWAGEKCAFKEM